MPMSRDGEHDAFWPQPWDAAAAAAACAQQWGVAPRPLWASVSFGGRSLGCAASRGAAASPVPPPPDSPLRAAPASASQRRALPLSSSSGGEQSVSGFPLL